MTGKKKRRTKSREPEKDVRGYIKRPLTPEGPGYPEEGHLEGKDLWSAVPPEIKEVMRKALKSGKLKISVRRVKKNR